MYSILQCNSVNKWYLELSNQLLNNLKKIQLHANKFKHFNILLQTKVNDSIGKSLSQQSSLISLPNRKCQVNNDIRGTNIIWLKLAKFTPVWCILTVFSTTKQKKWGGYFVALFVFCFLNRTHFVIYTESLDVCG